MKRLAALVVALLLITAAVAVAATTQMRVEINGQEIEFETPPRFEDNVLMVPLQEVLKALQIEAKWNVGTNTLEITDRRTQEIEALKARVAELTKALEEKEGGEPKQTTESAWTASGSDDQTQTTGEYKITVHGVRFTPGEGWWTADEGNIYLLVDVTVENVGDEPVTVSSLMQFAVQDSEGYTYDITLYPEAKGKVDGEIGVGRKLRGELAFEIPSDASGLELIFTPNLFMTGQQVIFDLGDAE